MMLSDMIAYLTEIHAQYGNVPVRKVSDGYCEPADPVYFECWKPSTGLDYALGFTTNQERLDDSNFNDIPAEDFKPTVVI